MSKDKCGSGYIFSNGDGMPFGIINEKGDYKLWNELKGDYITLKIIKCEGEE